MPTASERTRSRPGAAWLLAAALLTPWLPGCGQAQVAADHRELILMLATAASTRDAVLLDRAASEVDGLAAGGELAEEEGQAFAAIVGAARGGDWERAQALAYALRDGQHPTAEDQERVARRTLPPIKKVEGTPRGR